MTALVLTQEEKLERLERAKNELLATLENVVYQTKPDYVKARAVILKHRGKI